MSKKILIDAAHSDEIRLVLTEDSLIKSFDYHNKEKHSRKGNVYLARVTRVEPSLQAAFVDYGNAKQGFLPFSEIHPDYYHLPKDDKDALLEMIKKSASEEIEDDQPENEDIDHEAEGQQKQSNGRSFFYKKYKIQEVIKKDQVLLVQIIKEERGNKGASLTTYISLAGRYCVFFPNANSSGGVSRKIEDAEERTRLKAAVKEIGDQIQGLNSVIVRTAGAYKTKTEIKRDLNYLSRLWNNIKEHTLSSIAPTFIHEEGDIIKKAIRDMYDSDVEEILISGSSAYKNAADFTKLLLPRHTDKVVEYKDAQPIFSKYGVEEQLGLLYDNVVQLSSGGYIVINQTEALVAIDVNSGKSTSERNIESTAFKNNLEAAKEIYRQCKLRDLSGLLVIDFIDMDESNHRKSVEKALKDCFALDKARTQIGRISEFGLLEMSRQRLRPSFSDTYMTVCHHCTGKGRVRPVNVIANAILRAIENDISGGNFNEVRVSSSQEIILYILNTKREDLLAIEKKSDVKIHFDIDAEAGIDGFFLEVLKNEVRQNPKTALSGIDDEPYRLEKQEQEESVAQPEQVETKKKFKKKPFKKNIEKNKEGNITEARDDSEKDIPEIMPDDNASTSFVKQNPVGRRRFKTAKFTDNNHQHHKKKIPFDKTDDIEPDIQTRSNNNDEKNSSLLREIWKKIVE